MNPSGSSYLLHAIGKDWSWLSWWSLLSHDLILWFFKVVTIYFTKYIFHTLGLDCYSQTADGENLTICYRKKCLKGQGLGQYSLPTVGY